jgi:DNA-binding transcriptional LysR family regulator
MQPSDAPDFRTKDLIAVVALANCPTFVAAARSLRTSQPALTRAVKRVERALGVTLFARNTRRVEITGAGREFVAVAERVLSELRLARRNLSEATPERGRVTVSTYSAFAVHSLPDVIRQYREALPTTEISIREGRQGEIMEDVRRGVADFGIGFVDSVPDAFASELLRREPMYVVMPGAHPLALRKRRGIRLEELRDEVLISPSSDTFLRRLVDGAASSAGFALRYGLTVERLLSLIGHVAAGIGIALIPEGVLPPRPWRNFEAAILIEPSLSVSVGFITLPSRYMTPAATRMVALIRESCSTAQPARGQQG